MKRVIVFDLDDTLYNEIAFVKSGFQAVSAYLHEKYTIPQDDSFTMMINKLSAGRGHIFDDTLKHFHLYSKERVRACIGIYRGHQPTIQLDEEANHCLERLKGYPLYIVTDGNKMVQDNKLRALGLYGRVNHCYITHRYGIRHAKPSPYCFQHICHREGVEPNQVVYIGDNPTKDFVGIKPLGFRTVRIRKGSYQTIEKSEEYEADYQIRSLSECKELWLDRIFNK